MSCSCLQAHLLAESENKSYEFTSNQIEQNTPLQFEFFTMRNELVEILVEEGGLDREYTERIITQQMSELLYSRKYRSDFSSVAQHFACNCFDCFDCFDQSVSSASGTENLARRAGVVKALEDWVFAETSSASSQWLMSDLRAIYPSAALLTRIAPH